MAHNDVTHMNFTNVHKLGLLWINKATKMVKALGYYHKNAWSQQAETSSIVRCRKVESIEISRVVVSGARQLFEGDAIEEGRISDILEISGASKFRLLPFDSAAGPSNAGILANGVVFKPHKLT